MLGRLAEQATRVAALIVSGGNHDFKMVLPKRVFSRALIPCFQLPSDQTLTAERVTATPSRNLAISSTLVFLADGVCHSDAQTQRLPRDAHGLLENTNAFGVAYAMSFQSYDGCGDAHHGEIARRAVLQKLMACPFSPEAKTNFRQWSIVALPKMKSTIVHGLRTDARTCRAVRSNPAYPSVIEGLDRYDHDPSSLPGAVDFPCDMMPVYP